MASVSGSPPMPMTLTSDSTFYVEPMDLDVLFRLKNNQVKDIFVYGNFRARGFKVDEELNLLKNQVKLIGSYYSPEVRTSYAIEMVNDKLHLSHPRHGSYELIVRDKDHLICEAWVFGNIKVVRNGAGEVSGIRISNGRVRDLWLEKM